MRTSRSTGENTAARCGRESYEPSTRIEVREQVNGVGSGGQGRNRTNDTRIFSTAESPVRRE